MLTVWASNLHREFNLRRIKCMYILHYKHKKIKKSVILMVWHWIFVTKPGDAAPRNTRWGPDIQEVTSEKYNAPLWSFKTVKRTHKIHFKHLFTVQCCGFQWGLIVQLNFLITHIFFYSKILFKKKKIKISFPSKIKYFNRIF